MIHTRACERLLDEAKKAGPDVTVLDGEEGHTASLETSETGPARLVRVMLEGREVCWTFSLESGEERPPFYPSELPFMTDLPCTLTWDGETGLAMTWKFLPSPEWKAQLKERMVRFWETNQFPDGFSDQADQLKGKTKEEMIEVMRKRRDTLLDQLEGKTREEKIEVARAFRDTIMPPPMIDWVKDAFGDLFESALPDEATALISEVVTFHRNGGWTIDSEDGKPPKWEHKVLGLGDRQRQLTMWSAMGITVVQLSDQVQGPEVA